MAPLKKSGLAVVAFLFLTTGSLVAHFVRSWSYQELLDQAGLVIIATPNQATLYTKEETDLPGYSGVRVVGVETKFSVAAVFKGEKTVKELVLHHYAYPTNVSFRLPNTPSLPTFEAAPDPVAGRRSYLLFLTRESDGRYAPVSGPADPGSAVREIK